MGNFNIEIGISNGDHDKLEKFCSLFNLQSLIKKETCITKTHKSTIDLTLTNKPRPFQSSSVIETGLSDLHKHLLTSTSLDSSQRLFTTETLKALMKIPFLMT